MRWIPPLVVALAFAVASAGTIEKSETKVIDRVAIIVDGDPIFASDVERRVRFGETREYAEQALIDETLILAEAQQLTMLVVDDAEVTAAIDEIKAQNGIDDAGLEAALAERNMTLAEYRLEIERQLTLLRTQNVMFGGKVPVAERGAALATWIEARRARMYLERPEAR